MNDDLQKQLAQLASKLGTTVDHLWSVMVKQAPIDSCVFFFTLAIMVAVTYTFWKRFSSAKVDPETIGGECHKVLMLILFGVMLLATFILLVCGLSEAIAGFLNPEYWALQDLLAKIHGD